MKKLTITESTPLLPTTNNCCWCLASSHSFYTLSEGLTFSLHAYRVAVVTPWWHRGGQRSVLQAMMCQWPPAGAASGKNVHVFYMHKFLSLTYLVLQSKKVALCRTVSVMPWFLNACPFQCIFGFAVNNWTDIIAVQTFLQWSPSSYSGC